MSLVIESATYPAAMDEKLRTIRRRQCVLAVAQAGLLAGGVLVSGVLVAMGIDAWLNLFEPLVRLGLTVLVLLLAGAVFVGACLRPILRLRALARAAAEADRAVPQLEERWETVASFAKGMPASRLMQAMLRQVTSEAVTLAELVDPARVARRERLRGAAALLAASTVLLGIFLGATGASGRVLWQRFWSPLAPITATQLNVLTTSVVVPRGAPVRLAVQASGVARESAVLTILDSVGHGATFEISPDLEKPDRFVYQVATVEEPFRWRVEAGDARTDWQTVTPVDRPALAETRVRLEAPEYADRPAYEKDYLPERLSALQGSRLWLEFRPESALRRFDLSIERTDAATGETTREILPLGADAGGWYRFELLLLQDTSIGLSLESPYGLINEGAPECRIRVVPDRAPTARVISPTDEQAVNPEDVLEIEFEAHDDHGIAKAELILYDDSPAEAGQPPTVLDVREIPLGEQELSSHVRAMAELDLSEYELPEGAQISFSIRVTDYGPGAKEVRKLGVRSDTETMDRASVAASSQHSQKRAADVQNAAGTKPTDAGATAEVEPAVTPPAMDRPKRGRPGDEVAMADGGDTAQPSRQFGNEAEPATAAERGPGEARESAASGGGRTPTAHQANQGADGQGTTERKQVSGESTSADRDRDRTRSELPSADSRSPVNGDEVASAPRSEAAQRTETRADETASGDDARGESDGLGSPEGDTDARREKSESEKGTSGVSNDTGAGDGARESTGSERVGSDGVDETRKVGDDASSTSEPNLSGPNPADGDHSSPIQTGESDSQAGALEAAEAAGLPAKSETAALQGTGDERVKARLSQADALASRTPRNAPDASMAAMRLPVTSPQRMPGQDAESERRRVRIGRSIVAAGEATPAGPEKVRIAIRQRMEAIDRELAEAQGVLVPLAEFAQQGRIADEQIQELTAADEHLAAAEQVIAELRRESAETPYAFMGLQMVDIGRAHISPARDRVFALIRQPDREARQNAEAARHGVARARELLAELLTRFEREVRDEELAESMEEVAKMYVVYVENVQRLLRPRRAPSDVPPIQRQMAILEFDQDYLDRLREVVTMRRELMAEFGRMLADDPRLLGRYMDLVQRRNASLRDRLSELHARQTSAGTELQAWQNATDVQREEFWWLAVEVRVEAATPLVRAAAQLAERAESQLPLQLDAKGPVASAVIATVREVAVQARAIGAQMRRILRQPVPPDGELVQESRELLFLLEDYEAALELLRSRQPDEEVANFVQNRLSEAREVEALARSWQEVAEFIEQHEFGGLARVEQQRLATETEMFRLELQNSGTLLEQQFAGEVPEDIIKLAMDLETAVETVTFHQVAASYALHERALDEAVRQQALADESLSRAEKLFDKMRREVVEALDEEEPDNPNIADLVDPTLDEILQRLEREPGLNALLGIPNRRRNLRVASDWTMEETTGGGMQSVMNEAAQRARRRGMEERPPEEPLMEGDGDKTDREWQELADAEEAQRRLSEKIAELQERAADPQTEPEEAEALRRQARQLKALRDRLANGDADDASRWDELVRSDRLRAELRAVAKGEPIPDAQWNRILSSLDDGLWQVRRRNAPEAYRQAIEQYQDRLSRLTNVEREDAEQP